MALSSSLGLTLVRASCLLLFHGFLALKILGQYNVTWQCANLTVPVDYFDATDNETAQLGIAWACSNELESPQGAYICEKEKNVERHYRSEKRVNKTELYS